MSPPPARAAPAASGARSAAAKARHAQVHAGKRHDPRLVARLRGCLSAIAPDEARALMLRSGVGVRRSYRAGEVARMLGITSARENQIERRAAAALQTAAGERSCPAAGQPLR